MADEIAKLVMSAAAGLNVASGRIGIGQRIFHKSLRRLHFAAAGRKRVYLNVFFFNFIAGIPVAAAGGLITFVGVRGSVALRRDVIALRLFLFPAAFVFVQRMIGHRGFMSVLVRSKEVSLVT